MLVLSFVTMTADASDCGDGRAADMATNAAKTMNDFILTLYC